MMTVQARQHKYKDRRALLEEDLHAWGDMKAQFIGGLKILDYPSSTIEGRRLDEGEGIFSRSGKLAQPWYWSNNKLQRLDIQIQQLPDALVDVILARYAIKMAHREAGKRLNCHSNTVENRLKEAREILIMSKYWEIG